MDIDGSNIKNLTNGSGSQYAFTNTFTISPNSSMIAYINCNHPSTINSYDLCIMDINGNNKKTLTQFISPDLRGDVISFSPSGSKLIYCGLENGNADIFQIDIDGNSKINLSSHISESIQLAIYTNNEDQIVFQRFTEFY